MLLRLHTLQKLPYNPRMEMGNAHPKPVPHVKLFISHTMANLALGKDHNADE
jgi:hypothetical protein